METEVIKLLTYKELAERLDVDIRTISRWVSAGMPHKKGRGKKGSVRFVWEDVMRWLDHDNNKN